MRRTPGPYPTTDPEDAGGDPERWTRAELLELLEEVYAQDPVAVHGDVCQFCLARVGEHHEPGCLWLSVAHAVGQGDAAATRVVGEDAEAAAERREADEDDLEVLFPHRPNAPAAPAVDHVQVMCEDALAAFEAGMLHPAAFEPVRQAARIVDDLDEDEELVGQPLEDDE